MVKNGKCVLEEGFCKTAACVLGHAALMPEFVKKGLHVDMKNETVVLKDSLGDVVASELEAGQEFFELTKNQARYLFLGPWGSPKKAAQAIRDLMKKPEIVDSADWV